jgi:hypothetical protein
MDETPRPVTKNLGAKPVESKFFSARATTKIQKLVAHST